MRVVWSVVASVGASLALVSAASGAEPSDPHQEAVYFVAGSKFCEKRNPGADVSVESLIKRDGKVSEATLAEIRKIKDDPRYQAEINSTAQMLDASMMSDDLAKECLKSRRGA